MINFMSKLRNHSVAPDDVIPRGRRGASSMAGQLEVVGRSAPSVLLIGFYGRGNFGDDLMCRALTETLIRDDQYRVSVVSSGANEFRNLAAKGVSIVPRSIRSVIASMSQTDILCQGGGTNFHDSYKGKHLLHHWVSLLKWTMLFWIARVKGIEVVIVGAGFGPLRHPISRWITRLAVAACGAIGVRDQASVDELRKISPGIPCELGFDLAALSLLASPDVPTAVDPPKPSRVLGISACSLTPFLGDAAMNENYWQTMGDALARFAQENSVRIVFFSLFTGASSESDDDVTDIIISRLPEVVTYSRHSYEGDVDAFTALFDECEWFLATKFHAALGAYLYGCECAIVSYNRKLTDLAKEIYLSPDRCLPAHQTQPVEVWLSVLNSFMQDGTTSVLNRQEAKRRAYKAVEAVLARVCDKKPFMEVVYRGC